MVGGQWGHPPHDENKQGLNGEAKSANCVAERNRQLCASSRNFLINFASIKSFVNPSLEDSLGAAHKTSCMNADLKKVYTVHLLYIFVQSGHFRLFSKISGHFRLFSKISGHFGPFRRTSVSGHFRLFPKEIE